MGWMCDNFLKLNEKKTDIIELSLTFGGKCKSMPTVTNLLPELKVLGLFWMMD